jgi:hypothetical protein
MEPLSTIAPTSSAAPPTTQASMFGVYDGQRCIGHIISRGRDGYESFDANDKSIGLFGTLKLAADALSEREGGQ